MGSSRVSGLITPAVSLAASIRSVASARAVSGQSYYTVQNNIVYAYIRFIIEFTGTSTNTRMNLFTVSGLPYEAAAFNDNKYLYVTSNFITCSQGDYYRRLEGSISHQGTYLQGSFDDSIPSELLSWKSGDSMIWNICIAYPI